MNIQSPSFVNQSTATQVAPNSQTRPAPQMPLSQRRIDRDFPNLGPRLPVNSLTIELPAAKKWSLVESAGWYANAPVWWVRRISPSTRATDTNAVHAFLLSNNIVGRTRCLKAVSPEYLIRLNIKKEFWWISYAQIKGLSEWTVNETKIFPPTMHTTEEIKAGLHQHLYT